MCIIDRIVDVTVAMQRQVPTIQTVLQTVENLQVQFLDRVVDMLIVTQQKRSPARLCFSLLSHNGAPLHEDRVSAVGKKRNLHIVFYHRDVPDGMRTPWKLLRLVQQRGAVHDTLYWSCVSAHEGA